MEHFKLDKDGGYRYRSSTAPGNAISISISYDKDARRRGIYVYLTPVTITPEGTTQFVITSCRAGFLMDLPRKSDKVLAQVAARLDAVLAHAAGLFDAEPDGKTAIAFLQTALVLDDANKAIALLNENKTMDAMIAVVERYEARKAAATPAPVATPATRVGMWYATGPTGGTYTPGDPEWNLHRVIADTCDTPDCVLVENAGGSRFPVAVSLIDEIAAPEVKQ